MSLPRKERVKKILPPAVRQFAADATRPLQVGDPYYAQKLRLAAKRVYNAKQALRKASERNRVYIQRGLEKSQFMFREKVIFWSLKNALRAADVSPGMRREIWPILRTNASLLVFLLPHSMRKIRSNDLTPEELKQRKYAKEKIDQVKEHFLHALDQKLGLKRRKQFIHYFSLLYEGGHTYLRAMEDQLRDAEE